MMSPGCTRPTKSGVDVFHAVRGQLGGVARVQVAGRDDDVGVHIPAVRVDGALVDHRLAPFVRLRRHDAPPTMSGVAMWPDSAEAAAT